MYIIKVEKECGCFKKSIYKNKTNLIFDSKEDALKEAQLMQEFMNKSFCGKHILD
jgi:hypothetical protein